MNIEIKINKEIRDYTESVFFGLSARQCIFSVLALGVALGLYFFISPHAGVETVSWMCILGAAPFAACGFFRYHGMNAEQCATAWIKCQLLLSRWLVFLPENLYYNALREFIASYEYPAKTKPFNGFKFNRKVRDFTNENPHNSAAAG